MRQTTTDLAWNWMSAAYVAVTALLKALATATERFLRKATTVMETA